MFSSSAFGRLAPASLLALLFSSATPAADAPLTLREAVARTLHSSPELTAYEYVLRAQDGKTLQAGLRPAPVLGTEFENVLGTGPYRRVGSAELTISLSQTIELGDLRGKRIASAQIERETLEVEGHIGRLDRLAETARRFVSLVSQQEQHQLTHLAVELAAKTAAAVTRRVDAAKSPEAELDRATVALERARMADAHAEHQLLAARHELASSWGAPQPDFADAAADLYELPPVAEYPELMAAVERTPDLTRYLAESRLRESEITLALASRRPAIELAAGIRRFEESDDTALLFSVGLPLSFSNRTGGAVLEAESRRDGAEANHAAALVKARTQLFRNYRELLDQRQQVTALRERALPRMEAALRNTEYAYERGRYGYLELVDAQRELLNVRASLIEAATDYHLTLIEIERLTGTAASRQEP